MQSLREGGTRLTADLGKEEVTVSGWMRLQARSLLPDRWRRRCCDRRTWRDIFYVGFLQEISEQKLRRRVVLLRTCWYSAWDTSTHTVPHPRRSRCQALLPNRRKGDRVEWNHQPPLRSRGWHWRSRQNWPRRFRSGCPGILSPSKTSHWFSSYLTCSFLHPSLEWKSCCYCCILSIA